MHVSWFWLLKKSARGEWIIEPFPQISCMWEKKTLPFVLFQDTPKQQTFETIFCITQSQSFFSDSQTSSFLSFLYFLIVEYMEQIISINIFLTLECNFIFKGGHPYDLWTWGCWVSSDYFSEVFKLCTSITFIGLYLFISVMVTLTLFQGHRNVRRRNCKLYLLSKFLSDQVHSLYIFQYKMHKIMQKLLFESVAYKTVDTFWILENFSVSSLSETV